MITSKVKLNEEIIFEKTFGTKEVEYFAEVSEDNNPIHLDSEYAAKSIFKKKVVHGILLASMFSKIFGTIYPGNGGIYLSQSIKFLKPAFVGEKITAKAELLSFDNIKKQGVFKTECYNEKDELIVTGEAKILFPKEFEL